MTVQGWRLSDARYAATIWSGIGARTYGGRWNSPGVAVVYTSASRSLAALEQLVHLIPPRVLTGYVLASIIVEDWQIERVDPPSLPVGWDAPVAGSATAVAGDAWVAAGRTLALAVPSVVMPGESNCLINPAHADFASAAKTAPVPFAHDPRLA